MTDYFVRYADDVEVVPPGENETIEQIIESMHRLSSRTEKQEGHAVRVSHAKSHGVAVGELAVMDDLPGELRQGLFAAPGRYPVVARMANVPGELDPDSVTTQAGLAIKILGVAGEKIPEHTGETTQDFVLDTGSRFGNATAKEFLATHLGVEQMPHVPDAVKAAGTKLALAANTALHAVGGDSAHLDFFGHPRIHPLAEAYFSQAPIRYGDYVAKLAVVPVSGPQLALAGKTLDANEDENVLRTATVSYLRDNDAVFEIRIQLCTDLETMPIENAAIEWSEEASPYRPVATLTFPRQEAYSDARRAYADDNLSFSPAHSLAAFRPLGGIMRARLQAYPRMSAYRRAKNDKPLAEPQSISDIPD